MANSSRSKKRQASPDNLLSNTGVKKQQQADVPKEGVPLVAEDNAKKRASPRGWSDAEKLALERGKVKLGLLNTSFLLQEPGLEDRSKGQINMKLRGDAKEYEKAHGGDPKWVDKFKLLGSAKEK